MAQRMPAQVRPPTSQLSPEDIKTASGVLTMLKVVAWLELIVSLVAALAVGFTYGSGLYGVSWAWWVAAAIAASGVAPFYALRGIAWGLRLSLAGSSPS